MKSVVLRLFAAVCATALAVAPASAALQIPRPSQDATVTQTIGLTDIKVTYSRPGVKSRVIWGGLVPYDKPWRTGANEATRITFSDDVTVQGKPLKAGAYSLYTIPTAGEWAVVFHRDELSWGTGAPAPKPEHEALRVQLQPEAAEPTEWMSLGFENLSPRSGDLVLRWEKLKLAIPIAVPTDQQFVSRARAAIVSAPPNDWRTAYSAANYMFTNDLQPPLAKQWAEKATSVQRNYTTLSLLARMHAKEGDTKRAIEVGEQAVKVGKASPNKVDTSATEKLVAEWRAK
jgi:Protein of unknown function (DUF2911)